nr:hypothetical protein CFP56_22373 [Quercus suber]
MMGFSKHKLQHERPFRCVEDGCNRTKGFATKNDLERHRKTVHHKAPRVGKTERFICAACPAPQQGSVPKLWLRRDNFKAHIHRKHPGYPEALLIERSQSHKAADEISGSGYESVADISKTDAIDTSLRLTGDSPLYESYGNNIDCHQGDYPFAFGHRIQNNGLATVGYGSVTDAASNRASEMDASLWRTEQQKDSDAQYQIPIIMSPTLAPMQKQSHDSCAPTLRITGVRDAGHELMLPLPDTQQHSTNHLSIPLSKRCSIGSTSSGSDHGDGEFECRECGKRKLRECDLTRNDWNRHEYTQHAKVEMWRCRLPRRGQKTCGKVCYTVDDMRTHLKSPEHTQTLLAGPDDECEAAYIGAYGRVNFWCGFCDALIPTSSKEDLMGWAMRSKHIGDHYDKDCRKIEDWVCGKENRPKRCVVQRGKVVKQDSKMAFGKYGSGRISEDDSDLGDDGIPLRWPAGSAGSGVV